MIALAPDAQVVIPIAGDGGLDDDAAIAPLDATDIVVLQSDGGAGLVRRDAGLTPVPHERGIQIQVLTRPEGARLYAGTTYRGIGGTTIEEARGSRLELTCKEPGYKPGTVSLVFDGKTEVMLCVLQRIKICIDNIKNPFDDCEVDPSKPIPEP